MIHERDVTSYCSEQLNERIKRKGIQKWYMAYFCDIESYLLKKCLDGERLPNPWQLILMAEVLECTVNDLLGYGYYEKNSTLQASGICCGQRHIIRHVSDEIKNRMHQLHISVDEMADMTEVSTYTVNSWISETADSFAKKSTFTLLTICSALECTPSDLLGY